MFRIKTLVKAGYTDAEIVKNLEGTDKQSGGTISNTTIRNYIKSARS